jgi:ribonuclease D
MYISELGTSLEVVDEDITQEFYAEILASRGMVAMDIETSGLNPKEDKIATIQVYVPHNGIELVRFHEAQPLPARLKGILEANDIPKVFHYATFDLSFIMHNWSITPRTIRDTRVAATLLDPWRERFWNPGRKEFDHGLASLIWTWYNVEVDKSIAVSNWFGELDYTQLLYAARDVYYLPGLLTKLTSELKPQQREQALAAYTWIPTKAFLRLHNLPDPTERR